MAKTHPAQRTDGAAKLPGRFEALVAMMPPHAIRDEIDYENVLDVVDRLMRIARHTEGQRQYLETLTILVEAYEQAHHAIPIDDITGVDSLKYLMEQRGMNASDLGRLLGQRSLGSKILRGERELSKAHIRTLAEHFEVDPSLFF